VEGRDGVVVRQKVTVSSLWPADDAGDAAVNTNLLITFSAGIQKGAGKSC